MGKGLEKVKKGNNLVTNCLIPKTTQWNRAGQNYPSLSSAVFMLIFLSSPFIHSRFAQNILTDHLLCAMYCFFRQLHMLLKTTDRDTCFSEDYILALGLGRGQGGVEENKQ